MKTLSVAVLCLITGACAMTEEDRSRECRLASEKQRLIDECQALAHCVLSPQLLFERDEHREHCGRSQ
jgi:hypothetical protein